MFEEFIVVFNDVLCSKPVAGYLLQCWFFDSHLDGAPLYTTEAIYYYLSHLRN